MSIRFDEQHRVFQLDTDHASYLIGIADKEGFIGHIYFGGRLRPGQDASYLLRLQENPFVPSMNGRERVAFMNTFPMEYPCGGSGDYRESALAAQNERGQSAVCLRYAGHEVLSEKPHLPGLPQTFGADGALVIHCVDPVLELAVDLFYGVFESEDVITRSARIANRGGASCYLTRALSASLTLQDQELELLTLHGAWARENQIQRRRVGYGPQGTGSVRGITSQQTQPFLAVMEKGADQESGQVWAMHLIYSGNHCERAEREQYGTVRSVIGIHPEGFRWKLEPGEDFYTPEAVLTWSGSGLDGMTHSLHDLYRRHLIRSRYLHQLRPVLINNWEATYFHFDTEKLLAIAKKARQAGIEMFVLDDGWFGHRDNDDSSLGDWTVNEQKLPGGLTRLSDELKKLGMRFGIWVEPEMVSPDSQLYRTHPDWAIGISGRPSSLCRSQLVLDMGREDVRDYLFDSLSAIFAAADISFVKWDMNRTLSELGSAVLPADRQGELAHRYVLGVYELQERIVRAFPDILLENCAGGGSRFDPGMLYYSPQIWVSDDTDAIERLEIQEGAQLLYPLSSISSHISDCPNHIVGRNTPFMTRCHVALAGTFGYEIDVTRIPDDLFERIPEQIDLYHRFQPLVREGIYYRLTSVRENGELDSWMVVSADRREALLTLVQGLNRPNVRSRALRLRGLDAALDYEVVQIGEDERRQARTADDENAARLAGEGVRGPVRMGGDMLMRAGLLVMPMTMDFQSRLFYLRAR